MRRPLSITKNAWLLGFCHGDGSFALHSKYAVQSLVGRKRQTLWTVLLWKHRSGFKRVMMNVSLCNRVQILTGNW